MKFIFYGEILDSKFLMFSDKQRAYVELLERRLSEKSELLDKALEDIKAVDACNNCMNGDWDFEHVHCMNYKHNHTCFKWYGGEK